MAAKAKSLLRQIENGALKDHASLASILRKCIALGGQLGSSELRDWARRELDGYRGIDDDFPSYRRVAAPLLIDGIHGSWLYERRQIAITELPDFARKSFASGLELTFGVGELERMASRKEPVGLQPAGMADLAFYMNSTNGDPRSQISRIYFSVEPSVVSGVLDTIRTKLISFVAEIRGISSRSRRAPTAIDVDRAFQVVIKGRARANLAFGAGATATMSIEESAPLNGRLNWWRTPWAVLAGTVAVLSGIAGILTWVGWSPFG